MLLVNSSVIELESNQKEKSIDLFIQKRIFTLILVENFNLSKDLFKLFLM